MTTANETDPASRIPEFSLVLGGPLFQLFRRTRLSGSTLEGLRGRIAILSLLAWAPLLLLSMIDGRALGGATIIPFLYDVEAQVRFLIALPVLIAAELVVHRHLSPVVRRFVERRIVVTEDLPRFHAIVSSTLRVRNSVAVELGLLVLVYTVGIWIWKNQIASEATTWYAIPQGSHVRLTLAGRWYAFVSIPIFQFILLRWYMRLALWFSLLWRISRLNLRLTAAHPDRTGGIAFTGRSLYGLHPILFAQGALLSGLIANRVLHEGRALLSFKTEAAGFVALFVLLAAGPLAVFWPLLDRTKRKGLTEYGMLANRYVFGFEEKWLRSGVPKDDELLGTADIQSLADLGNSYAAVREMRLVPFGIEDVTRLAAVTAAPLLPLLLTAFSVGELVSRLLKIIL